MLSLVCVSYVGDDSVCKRSVVILNTRAEVAISSGKSLKSCCVRSESSHVQRSICRLKARFSGASRKVTWKLVS